MNRVESIIPFFIIYFEIGFIETIQIAFPIYYLRILSNTIPTYFLQFIMSTYFASLDKFNESNYHNFGSDILFFPFLELLHLKLIFIYILDIGFYF